ncbi:acylphosphatase [Bifidobacterium sp. ESL0790]|uniref:acylphosphatase n=1 Tax=Bifidobacterium sp. ESL0790 TaxID=2983233 RepID=UPI0023F6325E|nr:acylphosphatase [Bifidobacterium sp. ESL0790]WEV72310.1 acylphosphatase [Bifidobacterium sp. ESL0790]
MRRQNGSANARQLGNAGADDGSAANGDVRVHAVVSGLVQGVGYRYFAVNEASRLGVSGWVRNRRDGSVEVEAQGSADAVSAMVEVLKSGPRWGHVDHVRTEEIPLSNNKDSGFRVRRDAF